MGLYLRQGAAWRTIPQDNTRLLYIRVNGAWTPVLDYWIRDQSQWWKVPGYSPQLAAPTNLRMNPADPNNHSSMPVAWDWSGVLQPDNFHLVLTNEGGSWLNEQSLSPGTRSYTFSGLSQNTRYRVYVAARRANRPDTAWVGPLNWAIGADSYVVYDQPVYGWGGEQEVMPSNYSVSSAANNDFGSWGGQKMVDGNFSSYWNSDVVNPSLDSNQGEGWRIWVPGGNYLLNGVRLWNWASHTVWYGVSLNGGSNWQGGSVPYTGKYGFLVHGYNTGASGINSGDVRSGQYQTNGLPVVVDCLLQVPGYDGWNYRIGTIEVRLLMQQWVQTGWGPRTVAAVNSGYY